MRLNGSGIHHPIFCLLILAGVMGGHLPAVAQEAKKEEAKSPAKEEKKEEKREEKRESKTAVLNASVINYNELTHTISLADLRSGNHDPSGLNHYYFTAEMYALLVNKEEKKLDFAARKKITRKLGRFAEIDIKALSLLEKDEKEKDKEKDAAKHSLVVDGDLIRAITSEAMRKFSCREAEIAIRVDIILMVKSKRFYFLGQDTPLGTVSYHPIPETLPHQVNKENLILNVTDDLGMNANIMVKYKSAEKPAQKK